MAIKYVDIFTKFVRHQSFSGVLLFLATIGALIIANSEYGTLYSDLWHSYVGIKAGDFTISMSLSHWINDALMALFFLMVGLEIKREFLLGELAGRDKAMFPVIAALGGMVVPALLYVFIVNPELKGGFGIPMATDIAFALGVLMLFGNRVSPALKLFLVSFAVVDDLGAVAVIAIFYTSDIQLTYLTLSLVTYLLIIGLNLMGVKKLLPYLLFGIVLWIFVLKTGVHATVAGVLLALAIPIRSKIPEDSFVQSCRKNLDEFEKSGDPIPLLTKKQIDVLEDIAEKYDSVQNPLLRLEHNLHGLISYVILPLFAFANAGVKIETDSLAEFDMLLFAIIAGLVIGKPIGIFAFTYLADKLKVAKKPDSMSWGDVLIGGFLGGIGFTMSIFITQLAFVDENVIDASKVAILGASVIAVLISSIAIFTKKSG